MKVKSILLGMLFCMPNILLAKATQTWEAPVLEATELQDGSLYYVQNTGLNLQIAAGADWGTRAVLKENGLVTTARFDAATSLYVLEFSGRSDWTLFRDDLSGNVYTDQTKDNKWNIQLVDAENLVYTIQAPSSYGGYNANQYFGSTGQKENDNYILKYNRDKNQYANYIKWQFLNISLYEARQALYKALVHAATTDFDYTSYSDIYTTSTDPDEVMNAATELDNEVFVAITGAASPDNPADLTYYLTNPNFDNNTAEGWTGSGTVNYHEVEFYQSTFNMYQEITGLPAGNYRLKAQGFERLAYPDGGAAYKSGSETIYARLYAKSDIFSEVSIPFNSVYKHTYSGDGTMDGYVNTMASAERALGDGLYEMVLNDIVLAENDVLTFGAKSNFSQSYYWVLFDNFRLEYVGREGVDWEAPVLEATEVQDGSVYYVKNTGLNLQLATGADWGTRAVLKEEGLLTTVHFDAAANLYVLEFPGSNWTMYRSNADGDVYMDRTFDNTWNIQLVDEENLIYTIQAPSTAGGYNANQYFGSTGQKENDNYILKYNRDKNRYANYIKWQFLNISLYEARLTLCKDLIHASETTELDLTSYSEIYATSKDPNEVRNAIKELNREVLTEKTRDASPDNPVDITDYLVNPSFDGNTAEGWTMEGAGAVNYHEVEFYERTFDMYQEVTGLLPGRYVLKAQGFERPKENDGGAAYASGTETIHARLYANSEIFSEHSIPFNSLYKHTYSGDGTHNGYVNDMASAGRALTDGYYEMVLAEIMLAEDDVLTIGAKTDFSQPYYWVLFDNFRLEYVGFDADEIVVLAQQRIAAAQELLDNKMQNIERSNLTLALSQMQGVLDADSLDLTNFYETYKQLLVATAAAEVSILAYENLQTAIDSARVVYADGRGKEASALQGAINTAEGIANNFDVELDDIYETTSDVYTAIFAYRLANATGTVPRIMTNTNYVRGSTSILARLTGGSENIERGFCWSTHPEPTVLDNRVNEYFDFNGIIYHIKNLEPSTVYYIRAYNMNQTYAVSYGDILKVITLPGGGVGYTLNTDIAGIREGVESAVSYFNEFTSIQGHHVTANYGSGTPTAEASYGGWMTFGPNPSYQRTGTVLHEMGHTIGVGTHWIWNGGSPLRSEYGRGDWLGDRANKVVQFFDNNTSARLTGDHIHMWPYGINGAHEDSGNPALYMANTAVYQGLAEDGLPPTGGFGVPAYTFESEDNIKYYIKIEDEGLGRNTMYLVENAQGNLALRVMTGAASLADDKAAWYFQFNPKNCYYTIRNVSTGKYFTYRQPGTNGITLVNKTTPAASENFQMMMSRVNSVIGSGRDKLTTRTFWIIHPEHRTDPPTLSAQSNRAVTATNFNLGNDATTQRWFILTEDEVKLFDKAYPQTSQTEEMTMSQLVIYAENQQLHINNIVEPSDIVIYDISGRLQFSMSEVSGSCSRPLSEGVYFVSVSNKRATETKKVIVR